MTDSISFMLSFEIWWFELFKILIYYIGFV